MNAAHPGPDDLALAALPAEQRDPSVSAHLAWCTSCRGYVDELARTVRLAQDGMVEPPSDLLPAPERVWQAIAAEIGADLDPEGLDTTGLDTTGLDTAGLRGVGLHGAASNGAGAADVADDPTGPLANGGPAVSDRAGPLARPGDREARNGSRPPTSSSRAGRRRWRVVAAAVAAVAALAAGVGIGVGVSGGGDRTPPSTVIARLAPVDGANPAGTGTLATAERGGVRTMAVHLTGITDTEGADFLEVWLMNQAGTQIVALGALTRDGGSWDGSFTVPANLPMGQLNVVDVSAERFDGDAGHSGVSLLRGSVS